VSLAEQFLLGAPHAHSTHRHPVVRAVMIGALALLVAGTGVTGFLVGTEKDAAALSEQTAAAGAAYYATATSSDEALSQRIEKINVQQTVNEQSKEIDQLQNQIDNAQKNILNALMRNMNTKLANSRGTTGYRSYISQAKVLISLNNKIYAFKKTAAAKTIDISPYSKEVSARLSHLPTLRPVPGSYGGYGWRIHPVYHYRQFHPADDIGAPYGTSVKAAGAGVVKTAAYYRSAGNMVVIDHGNGFETVYMHLSKIRVVAGQRVNKGTIIGNVGSTGTSTSPHLHFEVHYHGVPFNPTEILLQW
jgi:murein DD-endopeptidase MepM/ murein hydrolase activator NlpD